MINVALLVFLILHFIADFYFQTEKIAVDKKTNMNSLIKHASVYQLIMLIPFIIFGLNFWFLVIGIVAGISHFIFDLVKSRLEDQEPGTSPISYILDQGLHILILVVAIKLFAINKGNFTYELGSQLGEKYSLYLKWILLLILILKPANITYKMVFGGLKPQEDASEEKDKASIKNAGAHIGNFERALYCLCLAFGHYALIGFIITCKGFARHSTIQNKPEFAEYFLIGTFFSILYSVIAYVAVFHLL